MRLQPERTSPVGVHLRELFTLLLESRLALDPVSLGADRPGHHLGTEREFERRVINGFESSVVTLDRAGPSMQSSVPAGIFVCEYHILSGDVAICLVMERDIISDFQTKR